MPRTESNDGAARRPHRARLSVHACDGRRVRPEGLLRPGPGGVRPGRVADPHLRRQGETQKTDWQESALLATLAGELTWHPDFRRRIALVDQAVQVARHSGNKTALYEAIVRPAAANWVPETSERRVSLFREAVALAEEAHDPLARAGAVMLLAPALVDPAPGQQTLGILDVTVQRNAFGSQVVSRRSENRICGP